MATNEGQYNASAASERTPSGSEHDQQQHWGIGGDGSAAGEKPSGSDSHGGSGSIAEGLSSGILPCRKRKAPEELPQIDEATAERLRRATDSLTKEQLRMLLARACSHYPGICSFAYR